MNDFKAEIDASIALVESNIRRLIEKWSIVNDEIKSMQDEQANLWTSVMSLKTLYRDSCNKKGSSKPTKEFFNDLENQRKKIMEGIN